MSDLQTTTTALMAVEWWLAQVGRLLIQVRWSKTSKRVPHASK
jgi:hypothetical protein